MLFSDSDFLAASERLELAVSAVSRIARGYPIDQAFALLSVMQFDVERFGNVIQASIQKTATVSDGPIKWEHGRGLSGFVRNAPNPSVFPHVWSSAHEAAFCIVRLTLEYLLYPLGLDNPRQARFSGLPLAMKEQFQQLLNEQWRKAMSMPIGEVADWQERIRRERAKLLSTADSEEQAINKSEAIAQPERLTVDLPRKTATLDGTEYDVNSVNALRWISVLARHPNEWISSSDLAEHDLELMDARTHRLKKHLPAQILSLIDSETGKGSRIRL